MAFLFGSIPTGILVAKSLQLPDPRLKGSGNIGAANLTRIGGKKAGFITFLLDFTKGALPSLLLRWKYPEQAEFLALGALLAVVAHCYTPFLRGRGGKGVATAAGAITILQPPIALAMFAVWLITFFLGKISSISALSAVLVGTILTFSLNGADIRFLAILIISLVIIRRHESNLLNILGNNERRF